MVKVEEDLIESYFECKLNDMSKMRLWVAKKNAYELKLVSRQLGVSAFYAGDEKTLIICGEIESAIGTCSQERVFNVVGSILNRLEGAPTNCERSLHISTPRVKG